MTAAFPLQALLFDLDGTLTNTDSFHLQAWAELLRPRGIAVDVEYFDTHFRGGTNDEILVDLIPEFSPLERQEFAATKERRFRELADGLAPTPGTGAIMEWAQSRGVNRALVTSAEPENVELMLNSLDLSNAFDVIVKAGDVVRSKPHPMPYLSACDQMGAEPACAIAFEDSVPGIRSASDAGALTVGIGSSVSGEAQRDAGAQLVIEDFDSPALWSLLNSAQIQA